MVRLYSRSPVKRQGESIVIDSLILAVDRTAPHAASYFLLQVGKVIEVAARPRI